MEQWPAHSNKKGCRAFSRSTPFCHVRPDDVSRETLREHRRPDYFFPARSITAATIARAPSVTLSRGAIWNSGEWCPAIGGPPALAAAIEGVLKEATKKNRVSLTVGIAVKDGYVYYGTVERLAALLTERIGAFGEYVPNLKMEDKLEGK